MNITIDNFEYGQCTCFADIFANTLPYYAPDTTFTLDMSAESHIIIDINGKCLFASIHAFMNKHNIPADQFTYITGNFKCKESYILWREMHGITNIKFNISVYPACSSSINTIAISDVNADIFRSYKYTNLNNEPYMHRVDIMNFLHETDLLKYGINSFHQNHHLLNWNLSKRIPIITDAQGPNSHGQDQNHLFKNSYFSIITESVFGRAAHLTKLQNFEIEPWEAWWREGHVTEKTFKAFFHLHPFIMVGAAGSLAFVKSLGFETFNTIIDESYDDIIDPNERMLAVQKEIKNLCALTLSQLHAAYLSCIPTLLHNQKLYLTCVKDGFVINL